MSLTVVGVNVPDEYRVVIRITPNGKRFRAVGPGFLSAICPSPTFAARLAWDHYYAQWHAVKPRLRVTKYGVTDTLTGHSASHEDVASAGGYAAAFRLRAERLRVASDNSRDAHLHNKIRCIADLFESIACRLETGGAE